MNPNSPQESASARPSEIFPLHSHLDVVLLREFRTEGLEQLALAELGIMAMSVRPTDGELVHAVFRALHTVKGMACFAGIPCIIELAQMIEGFLDHFRKGRLTMERRYADLALASVLVLKNMVEQVKEAITSRQISAPDGYADVVCALKQPQMIGSDGLRSGIPKPRVMAATPVELAAGTQRVSLLHIGERMERLAYEFARQMNREIFFDLECGDTEIDQRKGQMVSDCLLHLVRNALAHGVESPDERMTSGKLRLGTIELQGRIKNNTLFLSLKDDGRGLDIKAIRARGVELGLIAPHTALEDEQIYALIFEPGFSIRKTADEHAGQGVGLDAVRSCMTVLGGSIEVRSTRNEGSEFILRVPL